MDTITANVPPRAKVDFVFFDAGGGHRAAATALQHILQVQERPWDIRLLDLQDVLDSLDIFRKVTGLRLEEIYNTILAKGWTLGSTQLLPLMHGMIRLYHSAQVRVLTQHWQENRPDMVVSLVPNFNRSMWQALQKVDPAIPYVTILTDMADYPPHFWIEKQKQNLICGTDKAVHQARAISHSESAIHRVSGMILNPMFYAAAPIDRSERLRALGLDPGRRTGLVLFGGQGSSVMVEILERIDRSSLDTQLIMICGKNEKLVNRLRSINGRTPRHILGFTSDVPRYMQLADYFIGKPGPGSISEAIQMGLPVIVEKNAWTLPQERFNADWVAEQKVGESLPNFRHIVPSLERMLNQGELERLQANVRAIHNRAIHEIPEILDTILQCASRSSSCSSSA